jgi:hypothetical protein
MEFGEDNNINNFYLSKEYLNYSASTINGVANPLTTNLDAGGFEINNYQIDYENGNYDDRTVTNIGYVTNALANYRQTFESDYFFDSQNQNYNIDLTGTGICDYLVRLRLPYDVSSGTVNISVTNPSEGTRLILILYSTLTSNPGTITYNFEGYSHSISAGSDNRRNISEYLFAFACWVELNSVLKINC